MLGFWPPLCCLGSRCELCKQRAWEPSNQRHLIRRPSAKCINKKKLSRNVIWQWLPLVTTTSRSPNFQDDASKSHTAGFSNWRRKDFGAGLHPGPATLQLCGKVGDGPDGSSSWWLIATIMAWRGKATPSLDITRKWPPHQPSRRSKFCPPNKTRIQWCLGGRPLIVGEVWWITICNTNNTIFHQATWL